MKYRLQKETKLQVMRLNNWPRSLKPGLLKLGLKFILRRKELKL